MKDKIVSQIKQINIIKLVFSALMSVMVICSKHAIINPYSSENSIENTYFTDLGILDLAVFLLLLVLIYLIVNGIKPLRRECFFENIERKKTYIQLIISFVVIAVCYVPYIFSYWPGGVYSDTMNSLWIAVGTDPMTTHEPIGYTLLWKLMFAIAGGSLEPGDYGGFYMFTIVQPLGMALLFSLFINWNYKRGLKKSVAAVMTLIFALFPLFPYYGISLWKDTVFSIIIFIYAWYMYVLMEKIIKENDMSILDIVIYAFITLLVIFFRNNGIYVAIFVSAVAVLTNLKIKKVLMKLGITSLAVIVASLIIQHPVFDALDMNVDTSVESLAIPLQQTAYIVSTNGNVSEADREVIENIMRYDHWVEVYDPIISDFLKFDGEFNRGYFIDNTGEFMKTYIHLCLKNPVKAVKGYLLATAGYWDLFKDSSNAYFCGETIAWTGIFQADYYAYYTGVAFRDYVNPKHYIPASLWVWIMLLSLTISLSLKDKKKIIAIMPALAVWLTIMLATPIAFTFRYIYAVFLCMPIYFISVMEE